MNRFEKDWKFYLSVSDVFNFDGKKEYINKKGKSIIIIDKKNGVSAKEAFRKYDAEGKIIPTCEPDLLKKVLKTKGSVNLHIKMYAEDRANGLYPLDEFKQFVKKHQLPEWFFKAVENQKFKYYDK